MGIAVDDRTPLFLRADGQLFSRYGSSTLDDFAPCEPWYLRLDYHAQAAKVWRATDPEPEAWSIQGLVEDERLRPLRLYAGRFAGSGGEVLIEVIDVTTEST